MTVEECNGAIMSKRTENFVTVVAVGTDKAAKKPENPAESEYVTVLTIGNENSKKNPLSSDTIEEVVVYRLPGERLGFGLKFEGGTKANEFVKRLFIQSCAPESPASRVQSSWGQLVEGDEVLEIDRMPVNTMTRIDCVRFLKDSSVAIKLMVRHNGERKSKSSEDLPVVISTEEKKPPPVPPRKIHRKLLKNQNKEQEVRENIVPTIKQTNGESFFSKSSRLQSPRNSGRRPYTSPDVPRRDRRFSDGSLGPPDAEVYVDLFLQDSTQSLSESDDTGSTISTVLDRFGSFPTTTTSSFAGSLPSTPTASQKQLDLSYVVNEFDDEDLTGNKTVSKPAIFEENNNIVNYVDEDDPLCFQDAPLSYGNETTKTRDETDNAEVKEEKIDPPKRPVVIPRSKPPPPPPQNNNNNNSSATLPRLVDFVPKSSKREADDIDTLKQFLENERFDFDCNEKFEEDDIVGNMDVYGSKWLISSHLATIGEEREEEGQELQCNYRSNNYTPLVIVESIVEKQPPFDKSEGSDIDEFPKLPPSTPRQPPDGHEFPDFIETNIKPVTQVYCPPKFENVKLEEEHLTERKSFDPIPEPPKPRSNISTLDKAMSSSNTDLCSKMYESDDDSNYNGPNKSNLHTRSQSLIDMSNFSKEKNSRWNSIVENRRRGLSKLKGLVIPEQNESDVAPADIAIPEIRSNATLNLPVPKLESNTQVYTSVQTENARASVIPPTWSSNTMVPKYSPAFKRKSLQVYPTAKKNEDGEYLKPTKVEDELNPPKSLESIGSPTKSDYSFEYVHSRKYHNEKTEQNHDESDNDSAVSSSQSSYNSRFSPPPSPDQSRVLKPFSVEAINRKNILASAKCRSGKDFKIGSPVIQRKREEEKAEEELKKKLANKNIVEVDNKPGNVVTVQKEEVKLVKPEKPNDLPAAPVASAEPKPKLKPPPIEDSQKNKIVMNDKFSASSILAKRVKAVDVKALKSNFESMGSSNTLPLLPKRVSQIVSVKKRTPEPPKVNITKNGIASEKIQKEKEEIKTVSNSSAGLTKNNNNVKNLNVSKIKSVQLNSTGGSLGITLAGGVDYEAREITVHRIRFGSIAYNDGRLKKGDRIISINGKTMQGLSHAAAVELLKEPCSKFVIEIEECQAVKENVPSEPTRKSTSIESKCPILDTLNTINKQPTQTVSLIKDGAGLGFSIEGGKDSPAGDVPLLIKKIFTGGAADKSGQLQMGDEIIFINNINFTNLTRIEAWSLMKKIPDGPVNIQVYR